MSEDEVLYTLTEVAQKTKISMPTLQRYKKLYQDRIPSHGKGRSQRYPEEALEVFRELKKENIGKRGRPRKNASSTDAPKPKTQKVSKAKAEAKKSTEGLLTLTQISEDTGISYPTLLRYVKINLAGIPHRGSGRGRRFLPEAVEVFKEMKSKSRRGRKPASETGAPKATPKATSKAKAASESSSSATKVDLSGLMARIKDLEKQQKNLEKLLLKQEKLLSKPIRISLQR